MRVMLHEKLRKVAASASRMCINMVIIRCELFSVITNIEVRAVDTDRTRS